MGILQAIGIYLAISIPLTLVVCRVLAFNERQLPGPATHTKCDTFGVAP